MKIPFSVFGTRFCRERNIPAVTKAARDVRLIEISVESPFPGLDGKGRVTKWFAEAIHVGSKTCLAETSGNAVHMVVFDLRTRTHSEIMTSARSRSLRLVIGGLEFEPEGLLKVEIPATGLLVGEGRVADKSNVVDIVGSAVLSRI